MKLPKLRKVFVLGLLLAFGTLPAKVDAQILSVSDLCGGTNFATCMSGTLTFSDNGDNTGLLTLDLTNHGPGVFASIGIINIPDGITLSPPSGDLNETIHGGRFDWEGSQQLSGDGLPESIWAWTATSPDPVNSLQVDENLIFEFAVSGFSEASDLENIGFGVHAISSNDCSTKFGVWDEGESTNDVGEGNYDPNCTASVPEPASTGLILAGLGGLAFIAGRRKISLLTEDDAAA